MRPGRSRRSAFALGIVAMAAAGIVAGGQAGAGAGTACSPPDASFMQDAPGEALQMSAGYEKHPAPDFDQIGEKHKGVNALGKPIAGDSSCGDDERFATLAIALGDRADTLRLDGRKPKVLSGDPVPKFVEVTADGGSGRDKLRGHRGPDTMNGGGGDDVIRVAGGGPDTANCGPGKDTAYLSGNDQAVDCEHGVSGQS